MDPTTLFGPTVDLASKAIELRGRRHKMLLSNIANADTPGYKAFDLMVEKAIAAQKPGATGPLPLQRTHAGHIAAGGGKGAGSPDALQPVKVETPRGISLRGDGNTVDMDREMTQLAANQLLYKASTQIVANKFRNLKSVIHGGS